MKSKRLKKVYNLIENSVRYHYSFLDNTEQQYIMKIMKNSIPTKTYFREDSNDALKDIDWSKVDPELKNQVLNNIKNNEHPIIAKSSSLWKKLVSKVKDNLPNKSTPSKWLNKAARWYMSKRGERGGILGSGKAYEIMPTSDSGRSDASSLLNHMFPDFWGGTRTKRFANNWLIKDPDGTYRVNADLKARLGGENDPTYQKAKDIAQTYTLFKKGVLSGDKKELFDIKADLNNMVNDFEDSLFINHRADLKKDKELNKKFKSLTGTILNSLNPENLKTHTSDALTVLLGRQRNLDDTTYQNSPDMKTLYDIVGDTDASFEDRRNAVRLFNKNVRRNKEYKNANDKLKYAIGNPSSTYREKKKMLLGILNGKKK